MFSCCCFLAAFCHEAARDLAGIRYTVKVWCGVKCAVSHVVSWQAGMSVGDSCSQLEELPSVPSVFAGLRSCSTGPLEDKLCGELRERW